MIHLAFVGAGRAGRAHAAALKTLSKVGLRGVFDPDARAAGLFHRDRGCSLIYHSLAELAADPQVDGVLVCNPTGRHYDTLRFLLEAGKRALFCESPLCLSVDQGEDLLRRAEAVGARVMVGYQNRHLPGYARIKTWVDSGGLGRVRTVKLEYGAAPYSREWWDLFSVSRHGDEIALALTSPLFALLNGLFGASPAVDGIPLCLRQGKPASGVSVSARLLYPNNIIGQLEAGWRPGGRNHHRLEVCGDDACAVFEHGTAIHVYSAGEDTPVSVGESSAYILQAGRWIEMLRQGTPPACGLPEGVEALRVATRVLAAARAETAVLY